MNSTSPDSPGTEPRRMEIPLFPLQTVLFPGGRLPLRIFEPRYVSMVSRCLKRSEGFGVVLIRSGSDPRLEHKEQPDIFNIGTYGEIVDFNKLKDGLLGIIAKGGPKFRILRKFELKDHLLMGEVEFIPDEPFTALDASHQNMVDILRELIKHPMVIKLKEQMHMEIDFNDASSVGLRLSELLPLEPEAKQTLLQLNLPNERLSELARMVEEIE